MANLTLAALRALVRNRVHLSANDPQFPDDVINRYINEAMGDIATAQPNGWWFQQCELTAQNAAGNLGVLPLNVATTRVIEKVSYVYASLDGNYWLPITQRERTDSIRSAGGVLAAAGLPISWGQVRVPVSAGARRQIGLAFDPPLPNLAWTRVGVTVTPPDFTADADPMAYLPAAFAGVVVEGAAKFASRQKRKVGQLTTRRRYITEVVMCSTAEDEWTKTLRLWFDKPYSGPGYPRERLRV